MRRLRLLSGLFVVFCLCLAVRCTTIQPDAAPASVSALTFTPTSSPTPRPTPTAVPIFTLQNVDNPPLSFQFSSTFTDLPSGTYLIFNGNYYFSMDGLLWGEVSPDGISADVYFQGAQNTNVDDLSNLGGSNLWTYWTVGYPLVEDIFIRSVNLNIGEQSIQKVTLHPETGVTCYTATMSPSNEWIASDCWKDGEKYLFFLNVQDGSSSLLHSAENPCSSEQTARPIRWDYYRWSPDSQWLSATCTDGSHSYMYCLVSPATGEFFCPESAGWYVPKAWSPNSKMIALHLETEEGSDLLITNIDCLKDAGMCPEYFRASIADSSSPYGFLGGVAWDWSGERVVWSTYDMNYTTEGYATIWTVDLSTGKVESIAGPRGAIVEAVSPDGNWIVIYTYNSVDDHGLMLLSENGQILRRLPEDWDGGPFGWYVVP